MQYNFKQIIFNNNTSTHNQPVGLTAESVINGAIFSGYMPIVQLGVRGLPGTKFYINGNHNPVVIGFTGLFEIDLTNKGTINSLTFDESSIAEIQRNDSAYLVVDMAYAGGN